MRQLTDTPTSLIAMLESSLGRVQGSQPGSHQSCSSSRSASLSSSCVCWYHRRFGPNAPSQETARPATSDGKCLFFLKDRTSGLSFLVDTDAEISMFPPSGSPPSRRTTGYSLQAANHSPIATYGTRSMTLNLGLRRTRWIFIIAEVRHAILGANFLHLLDFLSILGDHISWIR